MMDWHKEAIRLSLEENKNAREIYDILKNIDPELKTLGDTRGYQRVRYYIQKYRRKHNLRRDCAGNDLTPKTVARKSSYSFQNGNHTYEDIIEVIDGREITPEIIMEAHNLKSNEWDVIAFCSNVWQQQTKTGDKIDLCQSKLTVKPKKQPEISLADVDAYFDESVLSQLCRRQITSILTMAKCLKLLMLTRITDCLHGKTNQAKIMTSKLHKSVS